MLSKILADSRHIELENELEDAIFNPLQDFKIIISIALLFLQYPIYYICPTEKQKNIFKAKISKSEDLLKEMQSKQIKKIKDIIIKNDPSLSFLYCLGKSANNIQDKKILQKRLILIAYTRILKIAAENRDVVYLKRFIEKNRKDKDRYGYDAMVWHCFLSEIEKLAQQIEQNKNFNISIFYYELKDYLLSNLW